MIAVSEYVAPLANRQYCFDFLDLHHLWQHLKQFGQNANWLLLVQLQLVLIANHTLTAQLSVPRLPHLVPTCGSVHNRHGQRQLYLLLHLEQLVVDLLHLWRLIHQHLAQHYIDYLHLAVVGAEKLKTALLLLVGQNWSATRLLTVLVPVENEFVHPENAATVSGLVLLRECVRY